MHRIVHGLSLAGPCTKPTFRREAKPTGTKARGLAYERAFGRAFPLGQTGHWYQYYDTNGLGFCNPDFIFPLGNDLVVFEVKLTDTPEAYTQISQLYVPVLTQAHKCQVHGIVVCKALSSRWGQLGPRVATLDQALVLCPSIIPTLHWLGTGKLNPRKQTSTLPGENETCAIDWP